MKLPESELDLVAWGLFLSIGSDITNKRIIDLSVWESGPLRIT